MSAPTELAPGLHRWTARHPEWHPPAVRRRGRLLRRRRGDGHAVVVDPLLPPEEDAVWDLLDDLVGERVTVAVTIPYHVRDAEPVWRRYAERGVEARITGHRGVARRLDDASGFEELVPGEPGRGSPRTRSGRRAATSCRCTCPPTTPSRSATRW
jgi:hypothetical protein